MINIPKKMNPTLKEIRDKAQKVHSQDITVKYIRFISVYFTWFFIRIRFSGNMVSLLNIMISCLLSLFIFIGDVFYIISIFLILIGLILDSVDGEVARFRDAASLNGLFIDRMNSVFLYSAPFFLMMLGRSNESNYFLFPLIGFFASWGMLSLRLTRTYVDATIVDGLMAEKTKDHTNTNFLEIEFQEVQGVLRRRNQTLLWIIDLILVRQIGIAGVISAGCLIQWYFDRNQIFYFSDILQPIVIIGILYAFLSSLGVIFGAILFVRSNVIIKNFEAINNILRNSEKNL